MAGQPDPVVGRSLILDMSYRNEDMGVREQVG